MSDWFGASWSTIGWVVVSTVAMYVSVLVGVRIAGRRTVARLSAFDTIVTIALGTLLSSTAVSSDPSYAKALTAMTTLLVLQVGIGILRRRFPLVQRAVEFPAEVVVRDGHPDLSNRPFGPQMTMGELRAQLRRQGIFEVDEVRVAVLEPTGEVSATRG